MVRPVGGLDEEVTGILPAIEPVESTTFSVADWADLGDFASGRLLLDAARLVHPRRRRPVSQLWTHCG